jgi:hypothetical protein
MASRISEQVMQWPPRPRPSSAPTIVITSMPSLRRSVRVGIAVICDRYDCRESHHVVAAIPRLPFRGIGITAGLDYTKLFCPSATATGYLVPNQRSPSGRQMEEHTTSLNSVISPLET